MIYAFFVFTIIVFCLCTPAETYREVVILFSCIVAQIMDV